MTRKLLLCIATVLLLSLVASGCGSTDTPQTSLAPAGQAPATPPVEPESAVAADSDPAGEPPAAADDSTPLDPPADSPVAAAPAKTEPKADIPPPAKPDAPAPAVDLLANPTTEYSRSPAEFSVKFETTKGDFKVRLVREWAPRGVDHFHHLVKAGYYRDIAVFRAIQNFMVQFGMHGDPEINALWSGTNLVDDPVRMSNRRGFLTYAKTGLPDSRSTQMFINLVDNANLDSMGFAPIGEVVEGMEVVDSLYMGYGEGAPRGRGPSQGLIAEQGNVYLKRDYPLLDYIKRVTLVE